MKRFLLWCKKEFFHILPVFIFFLIAFNYINFTERFLLQRAGITPFTFIEILAAAAVIAKILLVIDNLPFAELFPKKPLIYNVVWKTFFYWVITICVRLSIHLLPYLFNHQSLATEFNNFYQQLNWHLFAAIQSWYLLLFFIFVTARELTFKIGSIRMRQLFFGK